MGRMLSILITLLTSAALANNNPVGINVSGRIVDDSTNTALSGSVSFKVSVMSPNNCVLYSEEFNNYTVSTNGTFTFTLGSGSSANNAYGGTGVAAQTSAQMKKVFSNNSTVVTAIANGFASGATGSDGVSCPGTYTPGTGDYRKVRIEFDAGGGYAAILPFHIIRAVPYAMVADESQNAVQLGGVAAADYAKLTDIPDLSTGVPAAETDPNVQAYAKTAITGLTAGSCGAGKILTYNGTSLECVVDGGSGAAYTLPVATDSVLGGVMVQSSSDIAVDGTGNLTIKAAYLNGTVKYADMPATSCGAGEALVWTSPANTFTCYSLTIAQSQVTNLTTDLAAKLPLAGGTMTGALNMGGQDVLATGHITVSNQKTITVGKYDQTQENTLAGTLTGANEGATWYNSAMKAIRFWDGSARQTVVSTTAACADGQVLKWNDTTKVWYCAADAGSGGADASSIRSVTVSATAPTTAGQVLRYDGTSAWVASLLQASDLPSGIARSKVATGTANHVVINDGTGALSSEAQLAVSRGGTGQSTYTDGQLLIGKTDGTLAKANITAGSGVTVTNGDGTITIAATAVAPGDAAYGAGNKGIVAFNTDAATSGVSVASGVATVNTGTAANQIVKLDGTAKLPAVDGSALTNVTVSADNVTSAAGKYLTYAPNGAACANGKILVKTANGWECGDDASGWTAVDSSYAAKGIVQFLTDAATSGITVSSGVANVNTGTAANQIVKLDGSAKLPAVDGSALTNLDVSHVTSAATKYFTYAPNGAACTNGDVLKKTANGWECGADAGAGGADASSIRGQTVNNATALIGNFMQFDGTKWDFVSMPVCTADKVLTFNVNGIASCEDIVGLSNTAIAANAAIARTKLASGTANHVLINDGSGVMSSEAQLAVSRGGTGQSTYTDGQLLVGKTDGTLAKTTITAGTGITVTNGDGAITINATATAPGDAGYTAANKGVVAFATDADTSGVTVASGVATVNTGTTANKIVKLDGSAKLPAVDGSALTNVTVSADNVTSAVGKYFNYEPNGAACAVGKILVKTSNGWECGDDAGGWTAVDSSYAAKGIVRFDTDADTSGVSIASGLATVNTGTTANKIVKLDGTAKLPAVDGSALTNITTTVDKITSAAGKYFSYLPNGVACADQQVLKWDNGTSHWICAADAGAGGADASSIRGQTVNNATALIGNFMQFDGTKWDFVSMPVCTADKVLTFNVNGIATCEDIAGLGNAAIAANAAIARTKLASGTANHVLINDGSGVMSSEAQLGVSRGGTGQSTYTDGQILIGKTDGTLAKATITGGSGVTVTNGDGTISIAATATSDIVDGSIVDADVNASAAIARTKLANGTANRLVVNNGTGVMSDAAAITASRALVSDANGIPVHATTTATEIGYVNGVTSAIQGQIDSKVAKAGDTMTGDLVLNAQKEVRFADSDSSNYVGLRSPATVGTNVTFTLPATDGTANYVLKTDGSGNLGWVALPAGTVDASYAAKGVVQFNTDADTSGVSVASGVATVNTGTTANKIVKLDGTAKLPAVDGSALTNITTTVDKITSAVGKYFSYMPNGAECANNETLKWDATNDHWICSAPSSGTVTSITAGTGLTGGAITTSGTIGLDTELTGVNGLATTGFVQRTGAGAYSTVTGNVAASNSTVVTRDGSGVSAFYGVGITGSTAGTVTVQAPTSFTGYTLTLPSDDGTANQVLQTDGSGVLTWATPASGADNLGNHTATQTIVLGGNYINGDNTANEGLTVSNTGTTSLSMDFANAYTSTGATKFPGTAALKIENFRGNTSNNGVMTVMNTSNASGNDQYAYMGAVSTSGGSSWTPSLVFGQSLTNGSYAESMRIHYNGFVGIGTTAPGSALDVKGEIRMSGSSTGYNGFKVAANAGSTVWTLPTADGTANYVLKTDGAGNLGWVALPAAASDSSYAAKGVVQFNTDADTSGVTVAAGVATLNTGTTANKIVKLDGTAKLPAVDGSALTNLSIENLLNAAGKYFKYKPNNVECTNDDTLKWDAAADTWICSTPAAAVGDSSYAAKGKVQFLTDAATSGINVSSGVANVNYGTSANQIVKLDASAKLPPVDGSALTNVAASASNLTGTVPVSKGGTGQTSFTGYGILVADSAGTALSAKTCAVGESLIWTVAGYICGKDFYQSGSATSANYIRATGASSTASPVIDAAGTDTNIDLKLSAKGTGTINLQSKYLERSPAAVSGAQTIPADTNFHSNTLATGGGATTITLPDPTGYASNTAFSLTVKIKQPSSGADGTITWATQGAGVTIKWDSGTAPAPATGNNKEAIYQFLYMKNENIWYAMQVWKEN